MSHRDDCPTRWEAERKGERDFEWGRSRSSNPYETISYRDEGCPEAADAWRSGYRRAEFRAEEQREEEAARRRAEVRRAYELEEEAYAYEMQAREQERERQEYYAMLDQAEAESAVDPSAGTQEG